jgi:hypothetical protein
MQKKFPNDRIFLLVGIYSFICLLNEFSISLVNLSYTGLFSGRIKFTKGPNTICCQVAEISPTGRKMCSKVSNA